MDIEGGSLEALRIAVEAGEALPRGEAARKLARRASAGATRDLAQALALARALEVRLREPEFAAPCLERAFALEALSHVLTYSNDAPGALAVLEEAEGIARARGDGRELATIDLHRVQPLARLARLGDAAEAARRAAEGLGEAGDQPARARALLNLGAVLRMASRHGEALRAIEACVDAAGDDAVVRGAAESNRAEVLLDLDRFEEAEQAFRSAHQALTRSGNLHAASIVRGNLADLLGREGRVDEALEAFGAARSAFEAAGARADAARLECEEAEMLAASGAISAAADRLMLTLGRLTSAGLEREAARARACLGTIQGALGDEAGARETLGRALVDLQRTGQSALATQTEVSVAELDLRAGRTGAMEPALRAIESLAGMPAQQAHALVRCARALARTADAARAMPLLARAMRHARSLRQAGLRPAVLHAAGLARGTLSGGRRGADDLLQAARLADRAAGEVRWPVFRALSSPGRERIVLDACAALLAPGAGRASAGAEVFELVESSRARSLLDEISAPAVGEAGDAGDAQTAARYVASRRSLAARHERAGLNPGALSHEAAEELRAQEREVDVLRQRMAARGDAAPAFARPRGLAEVQAGLRLDEAIVVFVSGGDAIGAIVVRRERANLHPRVHGIREVEALLRRMHFLAERLAAVPAFDARLESSWRGLVGALRAAIAVPLLADLRGVRRLGIVPAGPLHRAPWAAVFGPEPGGADGPSITVLPSSTVGLLLRERFSAHGPGRLDVFAAPDGFAPLVDAEARKIARVAPVREVCIGEEAREAALRRMLRDCETLHLASHFVFASEHPLSSRVRCADGFLPARELLGAIQPGLRLVLAGCESARAASGEEQLGFVRTMLASGAAAVVGAAWPLRDDFGMDFFPRVYQTWGQSAPEQGGLADAIACVQRRFAGEESVHAAWWAGIACYGGLGC